MSEKEDHHDSNKDHKIILLGDDYAPPIIYTSHEDWRNYVSYDIVLKSMQHKYHEIFGEKCTREQASLLSYHVIEIMQMCERRDECYKYIDSRIRRRFNISLPSEDIHGLMSDRKILKSTIKYLDDGRSKNRKNLDSYIDYNLFGIHTPDKDIPERNTTEYKKNYMRNFNEFKDSNDDMKIISRKYDKK